jgi:hypothetical protein
MKRGRRAGNVFPYRLGARSPRSAHGAGRKIGRYAARQSGCALTVACLVVMGAAIRAQLVR